MPISIGGPKRRRSSDSSSRRFYEAILEEAEELGASGQMALATAFTTGQPWEEVPEEVQAFVTNLLQWTIDNGR